MFLLGWGIYATLIVSNSTSPSSSGGTVTAIMRGINNSVSSYLGSQGGNPVPPNSTANFTMIFETHPSYNTSLGYREFNPPKGGLGTGFGIFLPSDPSTTSSPFTERYAIFTFLFSCSCIQSLVGPGGFLGATYTFAAPEDTWIVQVDSPGNYTVLLSNGPDGNATGKITMSFSAVTFTPMRPYFLQGLATIGVAIAFSVPTLYVSRRSRRVSHTPHPPAPILFDGDIPTD